MTEALAPRWMGQPGRLEVWYSTLTDPVSGLGLWVHHEVVAPLSGAAYAHGWVALFRPGEDPLLERFGPSEAFDDLASLPDASLAPPRLCGRAGSLAWDLEWKEPAGGAGRCLFTFPRWAWEREVLPAAQVVPVPAGVFSGSLEVGGERIALSDAATGNLAHIYGHGSAERWGWLHADLGGGDVLEVVTAVSRRPGLNRLPPLAFVRLRRDGRDWPAEPLAAAPFFRTRLGLPSWSVRGGGLRRRLRVDVHMPEESCVRVGYVDPDGATATCTNTEVADAEVVVERRELRARRWEVEKSWQLRGVAHAEIGTRP